MYMAGYFGWAVYGALSSFNVLYYFDIYKRQYMESVHSNWDSMSFWTVFGGSSYIRLHFNMLGWFVMMLGWGLSCFGWSYPWMHTFYHGMASMFIVVWLIRIFLVIMMQLIGLMIDSHDKTHTVFDNYRLHAWGSELKVEDLYDMLDIELEAWNILGQIVAYGLYSIGQPLFQAQIDNTTVINKDGASCQLCFKRRQTVDETQPESMSSDWMRNCEKIRNQCELEARREQAKYDNRRRVAESASTDFIM